MSQADLSHSTSAPAYPEWDRMMALRGAGEVILDFDLPGPGVMTRAEFEKLPKPPRRWTWELRDGRLELVHMPMSGWHWKIIILVMEFWTSAGYEVLGEQFIADSGFVRGGTGKNNVIPDGTVFTKGYDPLLDETTRDSSVVHAVYEVVSGGSEKHDAEEKSAIYASLGIEHYWIIRRESEAPANKADGIVTMYQLRNGQYEVVGQMRASELSEGQIPGV